MIVGLGHQAQVGKDTAAKILVEKYGFTRIAFADALKDVAYAINPVVGWVPGVGPVHLAERVGQEGWEGAKRYYEVRRFLQNLGVAARDHIFEDVWVYMVLEKIDRAVWNGDSVVVTDVRFQNEFDMLAEEDAVLVKITRSDRPELPLSVANHPSETALAEAPWHYVIENDLDLGYLESELVKVLGL